MIIVIGLYDHHEDIVRTAFLVFVYLRRLFLPESKREKEVGS